VTLLQLAAARPRRKLESCHLHSITANQAAIIALFRVMNRYVKSATSGCAHLARGKGAAVTARPDEALDGHARRGQGGYVGCVRHFNPFGG
jgi:hypothetical protein